jgi:hypothetical protein
MTSRLELYGNYENERRLQFVSAISLISYARMVRTRKSNKLHDVPLSEKRARRGSRRNGACHGPQCSSASGNWEGARPGHRDTSLMCDDRSERRSRPLQALEHSQGEMKCVSVGPKRRLASLPVIGWFVQLQGSPHSRWPCFIWVCEGRVAGKVKARRNGATWRGFMENDQSAASCGGSAAT